MGYKITKSSDIPKVEKFGINLDIYPRVGEVGVVRVKTDEGHNQEFYDLKSTFTYIILDGEGSFFLDDEEVKIFSGDALSIEPKTRIYYKGNFEMILITNPAWRPENEVETRSSIW